MIRNWRMGVVAVALTAAACGDAAVTDNPEVFEEANVQMTLVSGSDQVGVPGEQLPDPLVVRVVNNNGSPLKNRLVNWRVTVGGGSVFAGSSMTNGEGIAQEWWTLGPAAGLQELEVRWVNPNNGSRVVYGTFTAQAGSAPPPPAPVLTSVVVTPDSVLLAAAGATAQLAAQAYDQNGGVLGATFAWTSSNAAVATVTSAGLVTAVANGTVAIVAGTGGRADTAWVTVQVAATVPPAQPGSEPVFGSGDRSYFHDDFEAYTSTTQLLTFQAVQPNRWIKNTTSGIDLWTGGSRSGSKGVRFTYQAGLQQQSRLIEAMPSGVDATELMTTFWIRTMPGYEWINASGNTHKMFLANIGSADRWGLMFGSEPLTPAMAAYGRLEETRPNVSIGANNYNQNLNFPALRVDTHVNDGAWHRITIRLTTSTSRPAADRGNGRVEMWIDGTKVIEYLGDVSSRPEYGLVNVPTGSLAPNFHFPSVMNAAPSSTQWIEYDDVRLWSR